MKKGKSLFLWGENDPYHYEANLILREYFNGMYLKGNYYGDNLLEKNINDSTPLEKSKFLSNHPISYGLNHIYEGKTICHPENIHSDFTTFAVSSNQEPLILLAEKNK
jgi:hypothetical protein